MKVKIVLIIAIVISAITIITSCQSEDELNFKRYYTAGTVLYQANCQNCHAANGAGLGALIPPLTDSTYLKNNLNKLACFVKYGQKDSITVSGKPYSGQMPQQSNLTSIEIAQLLTYVGNSFNNKVGLIDVQQVDNDLKGCSF